MIAELIKTENGYNFWRMTEGNNILWNITPISEGEPQGGYRSKLWIENIKHQKFDGVKHD